MQGQILACRLVDLRKGHGGAEISGPDNQQISPRIECRHDTGLVGGPSEEFEQRVDFQFTNFFLLQTAGMPDFGDRIPSHPRYQCHSDPAHAALACACGDRADNEEKEDVWGLRRRGERALGLLETSLGLLPVDDSPDGVEVGGLDVLL